MTYCRCCGKKLRKRKSKKKEIGPICALKGYYQTSLLDSLQESQYIKCKGSKQLKLKRIKK